MVCTVSSADGTIVKLDVARHIEEPCDVILPEAGSSNGGELVRIFGTGFSPRVRVEFGSVSSPSAELFGDSGRVIDAVTPPGNGSVIVRVINSTPFEISSSGELQYHYVDSASPRFIRGDCDLDGRLSITDAVCVLRGLFAGKGDLACEKGADSDDSGAIDLSDGIHLLNSLFRRGPPPAPPFPDCGSDTSEDLLTCSTSNCP